MKSLTVVRKTPEGILVVSGVFPLISTHGVPLDLVLEKLKESGMMPDWVDFYRDAILDGWKPSGIRHKLSEAVGDVYGPEFREAWEIKFDLHCSLG